MKWGASHARPRPRYVHPLGPNDALISGAELGATIHDTLGQYDTQSLSLSTALVHASAIDMMMIQPAFNLSFEGGKLKTVRGSVNGLIERELGQGVSVLASAGLAYRHNVKTPERSAWDGLLSAGLSYEINDAFEITMAYAIRPTVSGRSTESFLAHGPEMGLMARLTDDISLGVSYGYEYAVYDETSSLFPVDRRESRHRFAAELGIDLSESVSEGLGLVARYEFSATDATLPLYDKGRHAASVSLTYDF